jgi:hypothetical protein
MAMESSPDSGVETRNEASAPLFAPCFLNDTAAGSTPHDQSGRGTPKKEALNTERYFPRLRCFEMKSWLIYILINPAAKIPSSI